MGFEGSSIRSKWPGFVRQHHSKSGSFPNSKRIEEGKLVLSAGTASGKKLVLLQDWWLVKADSDSHGKQLGIGGFTLTKNQGIRCFSSAPIVKRHDAVTLQTVDSMTIMVHGYLNRSRTLENGFSQEVCDNFLIGFPYYWEDFTAISVNDEEPKGASPSDAYKTLVEEARGPYMTCRSIFDDKLAEASSGKKETYMSMQSMDFVIEEPKGVSPSDACKTPVQEASEPDMNRYSFDDIAANASSVKKDCSIDHRTTRVQKRRRRKSSGKKETCMSIQSMDVVSEEPDMNRYIFDDIAAKASRVKKDCSIDHRTSNILASGPLTRSRARLLWK